MRYGYVDSLQQPHRRVDKVRHNFDAEHRDRGRVARVATSGCRKTVARSGTDGPVGDLHGRQIW